MTREKQIDEFANSQVDCEFFNEDLYKGIIIGANWADEHPNTDDIETVLAYTYKGLGWLAENVEYDMGTMGDRALACTETLQLICNHAIMEMRNKKIHANV
jgi:hypothetical protein